MFSAKVFYSSMEAPGPPNTIFCLFCRATIYFPGLPATRWVSRDKISVKMLFYCPGTPITCFLSTILCTRFRLSSTGRCEYQPWYYSVTVLSQRREKHSFILIMFIQISIWDESCSYLTFGKLKNNLLNIQFLQLETFSFLHFWTMYNARISNISFVLPWMTPWHIHTQHSAVLPNKTLPNALKRKKELYHYYSYL